MSSTTRRWSRWWRASLKKPTWDFPRGENQSRLSCGIFNLQQRGEKGDLCTLRVRLSAWLIEGQGLCACVQMPCLVNSKWLDYNFKCAKCSGVRAYTNTEKYKNMNRYKTYKNIVTAWKGLNESNHTEQINQTNKRFIVVEIDLLEGTKYLTSFKQIIFQIAS